MIVRGILVITEVQQGSPAPDFLIIFADVRHTSPQILPLMLVLAIPSFEILKQSIQLGVTIGRFWYPMEWVNQELDSWWFLSDKGVSIGNVPRPARVGNIEYVVFSVEGICVQVSGDSCHRV